MPPLQEIKNPFLLSGVVIGCIDEAQPDKRVMHAAIKNSEYFFIANPLVKNFVLGILSRGIKKVYRQRSCLWQNLLQVTLDQKSSKHWGRQYDP